MRQKITFILCIFICAFVLIAGSGYSSINEIILAYGFNATDFAPQYITLMSFWYLPLFLFHILYGTYIYKHFCSASVYFFSRKNHRGKWFIIEASKLYLYALVYLILMLLFSIGMEALWGKITFDHFTFILASYYLMIHSLFLFVTTLAINLLAILFSSNVALILIEGICILGMGLYTFQGQYPGEIYVLNHSWIIKFNPISHLVLKIHSSGIEGVDRLIHTVDINLDLNMSLLLYLITAIVVIYVGCIVVKKYDFVAEQRTEGE